MLEPREVKIGESTEDRTRIISGVNVGETVVASATFLVDAESNLGTALGGMGDMPGMEMTTPPKPLDTPATDHSAHGAPAKP
jgi:Cu(I)/Ag(I) efflux system membrane fusion protein